MDAKKILLIDDSADDNALTKRALKKSKILNELIIIEEGETALNFLFGDNCQNECSAENIPIVVFLDINLPKVDGLSILRQISSHNSTKSLPVILLSGSTVEDNIISGRLPEHLDFIHKPIEFVEFAEAIRKLGLYLIVTNEKPLTTG